MQTRVSTLALKPRADITRSPKQDPTKRCHADTSYGRSSLVFPIQTRDIKEGTGRIRIRKTTTTKQQSKSKKEEIITCIVVYEIYAELCNQKWKSFSEHQCLSYIINPRLRINWARLITSKPEKCLTRSGFKVAGRDGSQEIEIFC